MSLYSSDEDDDDVYTNPAARLKKLKAQNYRENVSQGRSETFKPQQRVSPPRRVIPRLANPLIAPNTASATSFLSLLDDDSDSQPTPEPQLLETISPFRRVTRSSSKLQMEASKESGAKKGKANERSKKRRDKNKEEVNETSTASLEISDEENDDSTVVIPSNLIVIPEDDDDDDNDTSLISLGNDSCDSLNISDLEYTINVKIRWISRDIVRIPMKKTESFSKVFQHFATLANIPQNQIYITKKDKPINLEDTPKSLNISIIDVLEAGFIDKDAVSINEDDNQQKEKSLPGCKIKVQYSAKESKTYNLLLSEKFEKIFKLCADEKSVPVSKIRLYFDGDLISLTDTPESLDLDDDEACIDFQIVDN